MSTAEDKMNIGILISIFDIGVPKKEISKKEISNIVKSIVENDGKLTAYVFDAPPNIKDLEKPEIRGAIFDGSRFDGKKKMLTELDKMGKPCYIVENKIQDYDGIMDLCSQVKGSY